MMMMIDHAVMDETLVHVHNSHDSSILIYIWMCKEGKSENLLRMLSMPWGFTGLVVVLPDRGIRGVITWNEGKEGEGGFFFLFFPFILKFTWARWWKWRRWRWCWKAHCCLQLQRSRSMLRSLQNWNFHKCRSLLCFCHGLIESMSYWIIEKSPSCLSLSARLPEDLDQG